MTTIPIPITDYRYLTLKHCLSALKDVKGKLLDVGCGAGEITKKIKKYRPDLDIYGIDKDRKAINIAKTRKSGVKFRVADVYRLPFPDSFFPITFNHHLLEHLSRPAEALAEINRVTKKDGLMLAVVPLEGNWSSVHHWFYHFPKYKQLRIKYLGHLKQYNYQDIVKLVNQAGFQIIDYKWSGFLLGQLVNLIYYPAAQLLRLSPSFLTENDLLVKRRTLLGQAGIAIKRMISLIITLESIFIPNVPQEVIHITAKKR